MCAILQFAVIVGATDVLSPKRMREMRSSSRAVKVIHRRAHERTKTIHTYIHINIYLKATIISGYLI